MLDFLDRGSLMEEAGGADAGGITVADAPSGDFGGTATDGDTVSSEVHDAEFVDPGTEIASRESSQVKPGERAVQNGKFTQSGRAAIEALRPLSPKIANEFTQAILTRDWFLREFPGGKREVAQLKALAQKTGGETGIGELQSIAEQMEHIDQLYDSSDPQFIDEITQTPEGQNSFVGLMEPALRKFEQLAPQQFAYHQAKAFAHLMDSARLPVMFARMADLLNRSAALWKAGNHEASSGMVAELTQTYNEIADTLDKVYAASKNPPAAQNSATDPALDDRARLLSEKEKQLQKNEWSMAVSSERKRLFNRSWAELTKGRNITKDQDATIKGFYELRLTAKIRNWQNQAARFEANGDKDGYLREQFTFFQKAIPEALRQAIQQALPAKPGPRSASGPMKPPIARNGTPAASGTAMRVAKMPPTSQLDVMRTTSEMLSQNKAYTKDGKLVQWS